ncbi:MAG: hypothetical protein AAF726_04600 [Planctomycetota bacterium]
MQHPLSALAAGAVAALTLSATSAAQELTVNGGFETGDTSSWVSFPTMTSTFDVSTDANTGSFSGQVVNNDIASSAVIKQANLGIGMVSPGDTVSISFAAKGSFGVGGVAFAEFFSELAGGGVSSSEILGGAPLPLTADWQTFTFTTTAGPDVGGGITLQFAAITGAVAGSSADILVDDASVMVGTGGGLGTNYCMANANSTGQTGAISATGSATAADNDVTLVASDLPNNAFGFFLTSQTQGFSMMPGGSQGNLCLDGQIGRYVGPGQIQNTGLMGSYMLVLDLTQTPTPTGLVTVMPGETWNFQGWHRDSVMGTATSNFTDGLSVTFQ